MTAPTHDDPLLAAFGRVLRDRPAHTSIRGAGGHRTVGDLDDLAAAIAARLRAAKLAPGTVVGLRAPNGAGFLAGLLAARREGHTAMLLDPQAPPAVGRATLSRLGGVASIEIGDAWGADVRVASLEQPTPAEVDADSDSVIKLSSGSTGEPRGIVASSAALLADDAALTRTMGIGADDRLLAAIPFSHSYGLSSLVLPALARGTTLVLVERRAPFAALEVTREHGATFFHSVPAYLAGLLRLQSPPVLPPTLRRIVTAGAPLGASAASEFRERFGQPIHTFYGASECGGICYDRVGDAAERGTVGRPVEGVTVRAERGRVTVVSAATANGYLGERSEELGDGRFVTGDLGRWRDGELVLEGRADDLINVRGRKVRPGEVEQVLLALSEVDAARAIDVGDAVGVVVASRSPLLTVDALIAHCREHLADYKVPRSIALVECLPVDARGKTDRRALVALVAR